MNLNFSGSTLRDYLRIIFGHKTVIINTLVIIMISVLIGQELKTPVYQAQVKMLVSAEKQFESPYYRVLEGYQHMTQNEIVFSNPVIERAVKVLKLHERPSDYELNYCSAFKAWLVHVKDKYLANLKPNWLTDVQQKRLESKHISPEQEQAYAFRMSVENLKTTITVEPIKDTNIFTIGATDFDPVAAATIANVVSRSYIIFDLEQQLAQLQLQYEKKHPIIVQLRNEIDKMTRNLAGDTLPDLEAIGPATVKVIEQAQIPLRPIGISKRITMVIALFMGLFVGVMLTFGLEYIDHTLKSPLDVETFLNVPLLGSLPRKGFKDKKLIKDKRRTTPLAHFYQNLSDQVQILMKEKNVRSILITASSPSDGSTTIIANLGNFLSNKAGHKVLIIDANLKTPTMHKIFKISDNPGLIDIMEGRSTFEKAAYPVSHNLTVLPAGKAFNNSNTVVNSGTSEDIVTGYANVLEGKVPLNNKKNKQISPKLTVLPATRSTFSSIATLDSYKMLDVINVVKEQYDIVLVDYANLKNVKDVYVLSSYLDGVALVVSEGKTRRHVIKALLSPLEQKKANFLGVILNNRSFAIPKLLYERL
ncbi:MAG: lipopolysaccharide biosynthesis protein [Candidatus Jettenia sp. CY-1]|nr:MAG: lipopolysaccharide biosynthesis protein [Candidatus Jettenia sp. CY-1]